MKRSRLATVLLLLTAVVALFGWRFANETNVRQADRLAREAGRLYAAWREQPAASAPPVVGVDEAANRASVIVGRSVVVPRGEGFTFLGTTSEKAGRQRVAAIRFLSGQESFLLLVVPRRGVFGSTGNVASSPFPGASFLSGEKAGTAFVLWKREGLFYCLVSDRELPRLFEIVRRHFGQRDLL